MQPWWTISFLLSIDITLAKDCYAAWLQANWLLELFFTQGLYKDPHASRGLREEVEVYWLETAGSPHHWTSPHRTALYMTHFQILKWRHIHYHPFNLIYTLANAAPVILLVNITPKQQAENKITICQTESCFEYLHRKKIIKKNPQPSTRQVLHHAVCGIYYTKASYINDLPRFESLAGVAQRGQTERERERKRSMWNWLQQDPVESWWTAWGPTTQRLNSALMQR